MWELDNGEEGSEKKGLSGEEGVKKLIEVY